MKQEVPVTLEQLRDMSIDYDKDLDDIVEEMPEAYVYEDEDVPLLCLENSASATNLNPVDNQAGL